MEELQRSAGPETAVAARNGVGFTSLEGLLIERREGGGVVTGLVQGFAGRPVGAGDVLSWVWFPERTLPDGQTEPTEADLDSFWDATAFSLDLVFTDGTSIRNAVDQYGVTLTPEAQDDARMLWVDQWNRRAVDLSAFAGRIIERVEARLGRDDTEARPALRGWLDDVRVQPAEHRGDRPLDRVSTTRGTQASARFSRGNNAPLVGLPHGGVFGLPMTDAASPRWPYAYQEHNRASDNRPTIQAFATSHIPSPWMGDRGVFQVMPSPLIEPDTDRTRRALAFDHDAEDAGPHRYRVALEHGVTAELTAGEFALGFRFDLPETQGSVILDHHGRVLESTVRMLGSTAVVEALLDDRPGTPPHFVHLRVPGVLDDRTTFEQSRLGGYFVVDSTAPVDVLLGISTVSFADAAANLAAAGGHDEMVARATAQWEQKLGTLAVEGATDDQLTSIYSGLYRLFLYPNRAGESALDGTARYRSQYGSVLAEPIRDEPAPEIVEAQVTTTNGFWDTYRTAWPLLGLLTPETAGSLAQGFVQHFLDGGWTPRWSAPGAEDCMTGTTSDTVFADLAAKGVDGFDLEQAYRSALKNATVPPRDEKVGRKGLSSGAFRGFVDTDTHEGMSWTLDAAINDWSVSVLASALARGTSSAVDAERYEAEAEWFARRSLQYRNVFDRERGFFIGRTPDGQWRAGDDFDPADWGDDYTETNAWGTMFTAPHDGAGVVELHGGERGFLDAFDRFWAARETGSGGHAGSYGTAIHEMTEARDIRLGMLGMSNQPAHHIPFFPMFAGRHDDAHGVIRECVERLFVGSDLGQGYPGDEDNGEMSAWYVFATIGLYPLAPATGTYVLVPPTVGRTELRQEGGAVTVIERAPGSTGPYIAAVTVDGEPWQSISIPHALVKAGAHIVFTLSDTPTGWASETRPVSASEIHGYLDTPDDVLPVAGSPLSDDRARDVVSLSAGEGVEFAVAETVASLYTVTVAAPGVYSWSVDWNGTHHRVDEVFEWAGQTRVFRIDGAGDVFRFTADSGIPLTQLELIPRSRRES